MTLWRQRSVLLDGLTRPWALVSSAAVAPVVIFAVQVAIIEAALAIDRDHALLSAGDVGRLVEPALLALAAGTGAGILTARFTGLRPRFAPMVPRLLLVTLFLTPVAYRLSTAEQPGKVVCTVNLLCPAVERARDSLTPAPSAVPTGADIVAAVFAFGLLGWGLLAATRSNPPARRATAGPSEAPLVLAGVTTGGIDSGPSRAGGARAVIADLVKACGLSSTPSSKRGGVRDERRALDGVDLTIEHGTSVVAIGADAETTALLRVVAGLAAPDAGTVRGHDRAAALVDPLGGWHTALTGRRNVVRRALLTGLPTADARARAEQVLEFAELHSLADVPVSAYTRAQQVRLGFSAIAGLCAPLLVWDDDLLDADPVFRAKCIALVADLRTQQSHDGRSTLVATTDMGKAELLGPRTIWLERGQIKRDGPTRDVLLEHCGPHVSLVPVDPPDTTDSTCRLASVALLDAAGRPVESYRPGEPITIAVELELTAAAPQPYFLLSIAGAHGPITEASMFLDGQRPASIEGRYRFECTFEQLVLAPRHRFTVRFAIYAHDQTVLYRKRVIASFMTAGSAADVGYTHDGAETRILASTPVVTRYSWRLPDAT
jgi:ABC-type polysaccharide/polyol phosphate transport system ATPase subunit